MDILFLNKKNIIKIAIIFLITISLQLLFSVKVHAAIKYEYDLYNRMTIKDGGYQLKNYIFKGEIDNSYIIYSISGMDPNKKYLLSFKFKGSHPGSYGLVGMYAYNEGSSITYPLTLDTEDYVSKLTNYSTPCQSDKNGKLEIVFCVDDCPKTSSLFIKNIKVELMDIKTFSSQNKIIKFNCNTSLIKKLSKKLNCTTSQVETNLKIMLNKLEGAYLTMEDITGKIPYVKQKYYVTINNKKHAKIVIDATSNIYGLMYSVPGSPLIVSNEELFYSNYIKNARATHKNKKLGFNYFWNFGLLHELAHKFNTNSNGLPYDYCSYGEETFGDLIVSMVLYKHNKYSAMSEYDAKYSRVAKGFNIVNLYFDQCDKNLNYEDNVYNLTYCLATCAMNEANKQKVDYYNYLKNIIRKNGNVSNMSRAESLRNFVKAISNNKVDISKSSLFVDKYYKRIKKYYPTIDTLDYI